MNLTLAKVGIEVGPETGSRMLGWFTSWDGRMLGWDASWDDPMLGWDTSQDGSAQLCSSQLCDCHLGPGTGSPTWGYHPNLGSTVFNILNLPCLLMTCAYRNFKIIPLSARIRFRGFPNLDFWIFSKSCVESWIPESLPRLPLGSEERKGSDIR